MRLPAIPKSPLDYLKARGTRNYNEQVQNNTQAKDFYQGYTVSPDEVDINKFENNPAYNMGNTIANAVPAGMAVGGGVKVISKVNKIDDGASEFGRTLQAFRKVASKVVGPDALTAAVSDLKQLPNGNFRAPGLNEAPKLRQFDLVPGEVQPNSQFTRLVRKELPKDANAGLYDTKIPGNNDAYHFTDTNSANLINKEGFKSGSQLGVREKRAEIYAFPEQTNPRITKPYDAGGKIKLDLSKLNIEDRTSNKYTTEELAKKVHKIIPEGKDGVVVHYGNGANEVVLRPEAANKARVAQQPKGVARPIPEGVKKYLK